MIPRRTQYEGQSYRLYDDYNDLHVFVEDSGFENLYSEIFRRGGLRTRKIFSLNGKESIVQASLNCNDQKCVYLVDRDWDDALNIDHSSNNLVVLDKNSIENYLLDYSGFRAIVLADNPRGDVSGVFARNDFDTIIDNVSSQLRPLFECYLSMQLAGDKRTGCSRNPGYFKENGPSGGPCPNQIETFINDIAISVPQAISDYFSGSVLKDRGHGKYMIFYSWAAVRHSTGATQLRGDTLLIRLAQAIDPAILEELCNKVARKRTNRED